MTDLASLAKTVGQVNNLIANINKGLDQASRQMSSSSVKAQKTVEKVVETVKKTEQKIEKQPEPQKPEVSTVDLWGDPRMNPIFLKVADFFGIDQREYVMASSKINDIIRWAETETQSKDPADIIRKIGSTSRGLQSPGWGEKRYAILYRYVKLARQKQGLEKEISAFRK